MQVVLPGLVRKLDVEHVERRGRTESGDPVVGKPVALIDGGLRHPRVVRHVASSELGTNQTRRRADQFSRPVHERGGATAVAQGGNRLLHVLSANGAVEQIVGIGVPHRQRLLRPESSGEDGRHGTDRVVGNDGGVREPGGRGRQVREVGDQFAIDAVVPCDRGHRKLVEDDEHHRDLGGHRVVFVCGLGPSHRPYRRDGQEPNQDQYRGWGEDVEQGGQEPALAVGVAGRRANHDRGEYQGSAGRVEVPLQ